MKNSEKQREAVRKANFKRWANPENHVKASKKAKEIWQDPELLARQSIIVKKGHEERSPEDEAKRVEKIVIGNKKTKALGGEHVSHFWKGKCLPEQMKEDIRQTALANRAAMSFEEIAENQRKAVIGLHKAIPDMSARQTVLMNEGKIGVKGWYWSDKNQANLFYRSTYELSAFQILEQMGEIKKYTCKTTPIHYVFNEKAHRYLPDIEVEYVSGRIEIIEIKADCFVNDSRNQEKFKAAQGWCAEQGFTFCIWTEKSEPRLLENTKYK